MTDMVPEEFKQRGYTFTDDFYWIVGRCIGSEGHGREREYTVIFEEEYSEAPTRAHSMIGLRFEGVTKRMINLTLKGEASRDRVKDFNEFFCTGGVFSFKSSFVSRAMDGVDGEGMDSRGLCHGCENVLTQNPVESHEGKLYCSITCLNRHINGGNG